MDNYQNFYIDGKWVKPLSAETIDVINPATEEVFATIGGGNAEDIDRAVSAARRAFDGFSLISVDDRLELLENILAEYMKSYDEIAQAITTEMGAPITLSQRAQAKCGEEHIKSTIKALRNFLFETIEDGAVLRHEPIGVCGMITPWNWPMNQVVSKVVPAIAAGCTMVLKPSEESPISSIIFTDVMDRAGVPAGVYNMVNGYGQIVGEAMSAHPGIDMMSFTGSTRAGIAVAKAAANTVKRVTQELGGKSANIILDDVDIPATVAKGVRYCMGNSGQSCNAPTRMLVPEQHMEQAIEAARDAADSIKLAQPEVEGNHLGPVVNNTQWTKIQNLIQAGIDEGATLITGGTGRPENFDRGYYVKPTVFAGVNNDMQIAREEIFGPVIALIPYQDEDQAVAIANDTVYGLAGYVSSSDLGRARSVAERIRAGQIAVNYVGANDDVPFGGYKQSGNGREKGRWGLLEYLEIKVITGAVA